MSDPNEDLIGYTFTTSDPPAEWTVTGTPSWSDGNYVSIEDEEKQLSSCRPAGLVRQHKRFSEDDGA